METTVHEDTESGKVPIAAPPTPDIGSIPAVNTAPIPGILTPVGLSLPDELGRDRWLAVGLWIAHAHQLLRWIIGDWLNYGLEHGYISNRRYDTAQELTGYDRKTLYNLAHVARAVPSSRRCENLSWSHHYEVAALDPSLQQQLLERASVQRLTRRELRYQIKAAQQEQQRIQQEKAVDVHEQPHIDEHDEGQHDEGVDHQQRDDEPIEDEQHEHDNEHADDLHDDLDDDDFDDDLDDADDEEPALDHHGAGIDDHGAEDELHHPRAAFLNEIHAALEKVERRLDEFKGQADQVAWKAIADHLARIQEFVSAQMPPIA
jgi:hypothetical protein